MAWLVLVTSIIKHWINFVLFGAVLMVRICWNLPLDLVYRLDITNILVFRLSLGFQLFLLLHMTLQEWYFLIVPNFALISLRQGWTLRWLTPSIHFDLFLNKITHLLRILLIIHEILQVIIRQSHFIFRIFRLTVVSFFVLETLDASSLSVTLVGLNHWFLFVIFLVLPLAMLRPHILVNFTVHILKLLHFPNRYILVPNLMLHPIFDVVLKVPQLSQIVVMKLIVPAKKG